VKVRLVPASVGEASEPSQYLTSFVIEDTVAVDAGSLGYLDSIEEQARVKHVFLSHSHIDHIGSLPIFLENIYEAKRDCVTVHGSASVLDSLRRDVFNDRLWPDFIRLSTTEAPFLRLSTLEPFRSIEVEGLRLTPIPVDHVVPTLGFVVESGHAAIVIVSDTGPTQAIWDRANTTPNLKAVFLEATFPNAMASLAQASKHLTPSQFAAEAAKLTSRAAVIAVHLKARFRAELIRELQTQAIPCFEIGRFDRPYQF
jgi:ribonuclease BN (tRNA processing enzyme)